MPLASYSATYMRYFQPKCAISYAIYICYLQPKYVISYTTYICHLRVIQLLTSATCNLSM